MNVRQKVLSVCVCFCALCRFVPRFSASPNNKSKFYLGLGCLCLPSAQNKMMAGTNRRVKVVH